MIPSSPAESMSVTAFMRSLPVLMILSSIKIVIVSLEILTLKEAACHLVKMLPSGEQTSFTHESMITR